MPDLNGEQIETLRIGLEKLFWETERFQMFLRQKLEKNLLDYASEKDPKPIAYFRVLLGAEAGGWIGKLVLSAHEEGPHNRHIAAVAAQLALISAPTTADDATLDVEAEEPVETPLWKDFNPYRGLLALREEDTNFLFGRDEDVEHFIDAIAKDQSKILLALGASGVGKSSLIFAGAFGALNRQALPSRNDWPVALAKSRDWPRLTFTPGTEPVRRLAGAFVERWFDASPAKQYEDADEWCKQLIGGANLNGLIEFADKAHRQARKDPPQRYLIYLDQGEELYTRGGRDPGRDGAANETPQQKEARRFSELLAEAAGNERLVVLMSARSDFLGQLQADTPIFKLRRQLDIEPLTEQGLMDVVRRPAERLSVSFEAGLDEALVASAREQVGGLPLLSDALAILWKEMQEREPADGVMRWVGSTGEGIDISRKLAERADAFVAAHEEQKPLLRRLFCVRLAHVPLQGAPTRQQAILDQLSPQEHALVTALADPEERILVTKESEGRAVAEVAHEALFTAWTTLRQWIGDRRGFYAWATQIAAERQEWLKEKRHERFLLTGRPLEPVDNQGIHIFLEQ